MSTAELLNLSPDQPVLLTYSDLQRMVRELAKPKTWISMEDFMTITGKTRDEANYTLRAHPEWKRKRGGVYVNIKAYNEYYHE